MCKNEDHYSNQENTSLLFFSDCLMTFHGLKYAKNVRLHPRYHLKCVLGFWSSQNVEPTITFLTSKGLILI